MSSLSIPRYKKLKVILWCLVALLAASEFVIRGPVRAFANDQFNDFLSPYVQTRAWFAGEDPYSPRVLAQIWPQGVHCPPFLEGEIANGSLAFKRGWPSPYPISAFPLLLPVALLPWRVASLVWIMFELMAFLCLLKAILTISKTGGHRPKTEYLVVSALAFAPFHTAISMENISLVAFALSAAAVALALKGRVICWAPLSAALCLKPTMALPFLIYLLVARQWRSVFAVCAGTTALFLVAAGRMLASGTSWFPDFLRNSRTMFSPGAINDFSQANPLRFDLVNLQLVTFPIAQSRIFAQVIAAVVALLLLVVWYRFRASSAVAQSSLLELAFLASVTLLPFYHRFYDASLLFLGVAWALGEIKKSEHYRQALLALLFACPFLLPGAALLASASDPITFPGMAQSWWWGTVVLSHQAWMALFFSATLLVALRAEPQSVNSHFLNRSSKARRASSPGREVAPVEVCFSTRTLIE